MVIVFVDQDDLEIWTTELSRQLQARKTAANDDYSLLICLWNIHLYHGHKLGKSEQKTTAAAWRVSIILYPEVDF